jgi:hypothetical protein
VGVPTTVRSLLAAVVATAAVVGLGVALTPPDEEEPSPEAVPATTTLADLDTSAVAARRAGFCDSVAPEDVAAALGGEPAETAAYGNGDAVPLGDGTDVAHEFGCAWTGADGTVARGWVFAPPVTTGRARELRRLAARTADCRRIPRAPAYGESSIALECATGGGVEVSFRGLLGDGWLTCSLRGAATAAPDLEGRADRWCASILLAAGAGH